MTIEDIRTDVGPSLEASVRSQSSLSAFKLNWEQTTNPDVETTTVTIYFNMATTYQPLLLIHTLKVYVQESCLGAPVNTVTIVTYTPPTFNYLIGVDTTIYIPFS